MHSTTELLNIKNLTVNYKTNQGLLSAVNDFNLIISKGEIVALVGESGCGKSTIAYTLMGLLDSSTSRISGEAWLNNINLLKISDKEWEGIRGKKIGLVFQNPLDSLNPVYRSGRQVYEAIRLDESDKRLAWEKVRNAYNDVRIPNVDRHIKSFPHELSGGMIQRVVIAMMISRNPELLIADEPTTSLDVTIEAQILEIMCQLREKNNTSILLITHNFGIVAEIADKIGVMYAGNLVEFGDVFSIFDSPRHPYTKALMKSLPRISKKEGRLETIEGIVPRIFYEDSGCRFCNRCPYAIETCSSVTPQLKPVGINHSVSCHLEN